MEDRLSGTCPDVDEHAVVVEAGDARGLGDEAQHAPGLLVRKRVDLLERVDVPRG